MTIVLHVSFCSEITKCLMLNVKCWKWLEGLELVSKLQKRNKYKLKMFIIYTNISPSFILILNSIQGKSYFLRCRNVYGDVINFEVCEFMKKTDRVRLTFLKLSHENFYHWIILLQPYVGWIRMKNCNQENCPSS